MRERRRTLLPSVLALTFVTLLVTPIAAASDLPAAISMDPATAGPGEKIAVAGTDFPARTSVQLQLLTPEGLRYIDTVTTGDGGAFDRAVTLPADVAPGAWELQATSSDAVTASHTFAALTAAGIAAEAAATGSGNSAEDIAVMLVISVVLAAIVGGVGYVYYQLKMADLQPGMATGEDPIWAGSQMVEDPAESATEQPAWLTPRSDAMPATADGQG